MPILSTLSFTSLNPSTQQKVLNSLKNIHKHWGCPVTDCLPAEIAPKKLDPGNNGLYQQVVEPDAKEWGCETIRRLSQLCRLTTGRREYAVGLLETEVRRRREGALKTHTGPQLRAMPHVTTGDVQRVIEIVRESIDAGVVAVIEEDDAAEAGEQWNGDESADTVSVVTVAREEEEESPTGGNDVPQVDSAKVVSKRAIVPHPPRYQPYPSPADRMSPGVSFRVGPSGPRPVTTPQHTRGSENLVQSITPSRSKRALIEAKLKAARAAKEVADLELALLMEQQAESPV
ncbi:hypothetical protein K432DRAFT_388514 [Lepidopterella palustris CBS 459.81]|uniref:Uncharacterized protein n=1 Tax=Lepidopterella palustris CBS 459.81 TaxID=1314670 RepID=A0A8E2JK78_9PEZI|nr:hypothetical protein K432DRAFT_388514 [Lepidopterella palustris CBS 459.81]